MRDKIMDGTILEDVVEHLIGCEAIILSICEIVGGGDLPKEALQGAAYLLHCIIGDFRSDIDAAEVYHREEAQE